MLMPDTRDGGASSGCGSEQGPPVSASTDAEGRYRLTDVPPGSCRVSVFAPAFVIEGATPYLKPGKMVNVAEGENIENMDFELTRGAVITERQSGVPAVLPIDAAEVDGRGQFIIESLAPGPYKLELIGVRSATSDGFASFAEQIINVAGEGRHEALLTIDLTPKERKK